MLNRPSLLRGRAAVVTLSLVGLALLAWLEIYGFRKGFDLNDANPDIKLGAGPLVGTWDLRVTAKLLPAIVVAGTAVVLLPRLARRCRPRTAIVVTALTAAGFALALSASDGWKAVIKPVIDKTEYWRGTLTAKPAGDYLHTFLERQKLYSVHVRGHPPGFTLLLLAMRAIGLGSAWFAAALSFLGIALAVGAVAYTVLRVCGRSTLRRSLPFLALAPYAVWQGTSADAFYSGFAAVGIALLVLAMTTTQRRHEIAAAAVGGAVLGASCFFTFGAPTLLPLVLALAWRTRRIRWVVPGLVGTGLVVVAYAVNDYWWIDGLDNTRHFYEIGTAKFRPAFYFFFANLAALAIAIGPAALAGLTRICRTHVAIVVVGALGCVLLADASGLSKAETERIWLLYMPWLSVAAGTLATTLRRQQVWLGLQAIAAIGLQALLVTKW